MVSELKYETDNILIQSKFAYPQTSKAINPIIMSNYVSNIYDVTATIITENHTYVKDEDIYDDAYLPIMDPNGYDMQLIVSEKLLNKLVYLIYNVSEYGDESPFIVD